MSIYSANGLGFTVALLSKIRSGTEFVKKSFISYLPKLKVNRTHSNRYIPGRKNNRFFWSGKYWN